MKSPIITREETDIDLAQEATTFCLKAGTVVCGLIGIWALTCLTVALVKFGPMQMIRGYITAITGY